MLFGETPQSTQIFNGALRRAINNELFLLKNIDNMIVGKVDLYKKKKNHVAKCQGKGATGPQSCKR